MAALVDRFDGERPEHLVGVGALEFVAGRDVDGADLDAGHRFGVGAGDDHAGRRRDRRAPR